MAGILGIVMMGHMIVKGMLGFMGPNPSFGLVEGFYLGVYEPVFRKF